ncbi:MAG TPA: hypothetical protein VGI45_17940 [Terracidiphilus sp.]
MKFQILMAQHPMCLHVVSGLLPADRSFENPASRQVVEQFQWLSGLRCAGEDKAHATAHRLTIKVCRMDHLYTRSRGG